MRTGAAIGLVFISGFAIMVLEIIGARYLTAEFGGSFYVWISQIGVVMVALALGYYSGGALGDRFERAAALSFLLMPAGVFVFLIPNFAPGWIDAIIMRHPLEKEIPAIWQKLDPVIGSSLIFLFPCFVLAMLGPCMIRLSARKLAHVGRISGSIYAAGTLGSIAGVFVSGYVLIDYMNISNIFRSTGAIIFGLGGVCLRLDRWFGRAAELELEKTPSGKEACL